MNNSGFLFSLNSFSDVIYETTSLPAPYFVNPVNQKKRGLSIIYSFMRTHNMWKSLHAHCILPPTSTCMNPSYGHSLVKQNSESIRNAELVLFPLFFWYNPISIYYFCCLFILLIYHIWIF